MDIDFTDIDETPVIDELSPLEKKKKSVVRMNSLAEGEDYHQNVALKAAVLSLNKN